MVTAKKSDKKAKLLNADLDLEYFEILDSVIAEQNLNGRREGLAVIFKGYLRSINPSSVEVEPSICEFLSDDKTLCCKNKDKIKKTTIKECKGCQKTQEIAARNQRMEELRFHGELLRHDLTEQMWIFELGVPFEKTGYDTFNRLVFLKEKLDQKEREIAKLLPLEIENASLKQQLSEKAMEIQTLKAENAKQETTINDYMFQRKTQ